MDFRTNAAEATRQVLGGSAGASVGSLNDSGCIPVPGGRTLQCIAEISTLFVSMACLFIGVLALPLNMFGVIPTQWVAPLLFVGLGITLVARKIKSWLLRGCLSVRRDCLLRLLPSLPRRAVAMEDGKTHKQTKLVPEDEGVCLLDSERQRLLIEGCSYRYAIHAKDVRSVSPVSGYALSGARLVCRMAGGELNFVLTVAGHGPLASLIQAFNPRGAAQGLASVLNQTLFRENAPTHEQAELPPPLPPRPR